MHVKPLWTSYVMPIDTATSARFSRAYAYINKEGGYASSTCVLAIYFELPNTQC